jgi:hypothetical protein
LCPIVYLLDKYADIASSPFEEIMNSLRKLFAAIVLLALSAVIGVTSARAAPETPQLGQTSQTSLLSSVLSVVNAVGDDAFSTTDLSSLVDPSTTATQHYGPYLTGSPDSGTCGNNWADDTFNRHFTVFMNRLSGAILVVEQFKDGNFSTPSTTPPNTNQSPDACNTTPPPTGNGGTVNPGITGNLHGYFIVQPIAAGSQVSTDPHCNATTMTNSGCDTTTFINTHFAPCYPVTCTVTTFFFHYTAANQDLTSHEWTNASPDRGGNRGDIRSN